MSDRKDVQFDGFSAETIFFLKNLRENNHREWFLARKKDYYKKVVQPAGYFVQEMCTMLESISPGIQAVPKSTAQSACIYQDPRFARIRILPLLFGYLVLVWCEKGKNLPVIILN